MKAVRDTPSSDGACVYEVSSNYVERIKRYGPDKQKVNGRTHRRTDNPRHTIIRPVDDGRIKRSKIYQGRDRETANCVERAEEKPTRKHECTIKT
jgi:hypothetical protein